MAAMQHPGGGKNDIPNRLKRHFACFNVPLPSADSIGSVFGKLVVGRFFLQRVLPEAGAHLTKLTSGSDLMMALPADAF
jgi:dynein heavy chain